MRLNENTVRGWREQMKVAAQNNVKVCASCCHFRPFPLQRPGIYVGPDGHCPMVEVQIENANRRGCDGWQSDIGNRRDRATAKGDLT